MGELAERRSQTKQRIVDLAGQLGTADRLLKDKACVYATGSFGRCEASAYSDLDLFILGKNNGKQGLDDREGSLLSRLDEICVKAELIKVSRRTGLPEFSGDGRYLGHYSVSEFIETLGTEKDDVTNTFTARLLLLLESRPLLESSVYDEAVGDIIEAYWRDYEDRRAEFMPAFLANDILRLWRTFCVNYEARTERVPDEEKAKGKLKNYKLKHSRLLTCYSGLLFLLAVFNEQKTVHPSDVRAMVGLSPTERLEWLHDRPDLRQSRGAISKLLAQYERFLARTNASEGALVSVFLERETGRQYMGEAYEFGDRMFEVLNGIGRATRFHRLLVV